MAKHHDEKCPHPGYYTVKICNMEKKMCWIQSICLLQLLAADNSCNRSILDPVHLSIASIYHVFSRVRKYPELWVNFQVKIENVTSVYA